MEYRFSKDPLFGKYCYIDTPWIAGKNTIYRIVNSGVRSNTWCEVPVTGRTEQVIHNYSEDIVFVVLDTLIDEYSRIMRFALKDIVLVDAPQTDLAEDAPRLEVTREEFEKITERIKDAPLKTERLADCAWRKPE